MRASFPRSALPSELFMTLIALLWGSAFPITRVLLREMPPLGAAAWRTALAASAVLVVIVVRGEVGGLLVRRADAGRLAVVALLGGAFFVISMNLGIFLTGASITSFVTGLYPILAVVLAGLFFGEPVRRRAVVALSVAAVGLMLLARPGGAHVDLLGVAAGLGAAFSFALYLSLARRWVHAERMPPLTIAFALLLSSVLVAGIGQAVVDPSGLALSLSGAGWAALLWLALPASALPHVLVIATLRRLPAGRAAPFLLLMPISGTVIAAALLGERLDLVQLAGAGLILAGIGAATLRRGA